MLSILIPVYAYDCRKLVDTLLEQGRALALPFELLLFDDGSSEDIRLLHRPLVASPEVKYREMPQNIGRAAIRNELAAAAQYRYLLFLDCDSQVVKPDFLEAYVSQFRPDTVIYGGRCYAPRPPKDISCYLHWYFGCKREAQPAFMRRIKPYHGFMTNNFCMARSTFLDIGFDANIRQYGHEDTLFGWQLQQRGIPILHIDNPLQHDGLETADVFIRKQEQAVDNLRHLAQVYPGLDTKLLKTAALLQRYHLSDSIYWGLNKARNWLRAQLKAGQPKLFYLDLLKLYWLLRQ